jgi:excisionase family DNA binding protein
VFRERIATNWWSESSVLPTRTSAVMSSWENSVSQGQQALSRLLTVKEAAEFANCCEETVRRAYIANQLAIIPFGGRGIRIHPEDLRDWVANGMPTCSSVN